GSRADAGWLVGDGGSVHTDGGATWHVGDGGKVADAWVHTDGGATWHVGDGGLRYVDGGACNIPGAVIAIGSGVTYSIAAGAGLRGAANEMSDGTRLFF